MITNLIKLKRSFQRFARGPLLFFLAHPRAFGRGIVAGPFKGTMMSINTTWSNPIYLFVGSYERELHRIWKSLKPIQSVAVWVIGAAEGYYACGIAKQWDAKVTAYELSDDSRKVLTRNIRLNGLQDSIEVFGKCEKADLTTRLKRDAPNLIVCDIEGGEDEIFSDELLCMLGKTALVIEMHPPYGLLSRIGILARTHNVEIVNPADRCIADYPYRDWIPNKIKLRWLDERRPFPTPWLVALPLNRMPSASP